jgi:hypothetical protein
MGNAQAQLSSSENLSYDQILTIHQNTAKLLDEIAKRQEESLKRQEESLNRQEKTDKLVEDLNHRFGNFSNRLGEIAEYMIAPNLREKFSELGLDFPKANKNTDVSDHKNNIFLEIDVMLENGDKAMLVEVKTKLTADHVKDNIERLEKMRKYADLHGDKRTFLGGIAGVIIPSNIRDFALKQGFYVIEPSGATFNITPPYGKPKEW